MFIYREMKESLENRDPLDHLVKRGQVVPQEWLGILEMLENR